METKNPKSQSRGFALIATLSLMVLLAILAVGLLSLSSISLRAASSGSAKAEAMANARLALQLAIGGLQRELGPDQRINAYAELANPSVDPSRGSWLGVWESWPGDQKNRPSPVFRSWLVSGDPAALNNPDPSASTGKTVNLAHSNSTRPVLVPLQPLSKGGFAYWVSDENSKARLGPAFDPDAENLAAHLGRWQSAPAAGHQTLSNFSIVGRDDPRLDQMISTKTVNFIEANPPSSPDEAALSVWSEGLATNVRDGGFREDLSLFLSDPSSADAENALYQSTEGRGGINFRELHAFQNVWTKLSYGGGFSHQDGKPLNSGVPTLAGPADRLAATVDPFFNYMRPIVLRGSWHVSAMTRKVSDTPAQYELFIVIEPVVTLWNPYDVNLVMKPGGHLTVRCWGLPYNFDVTVGSTKKTLTFNSINSNNVAMEIGQTQSVVMRPGEVQIFSRGQEATTTANRAGRFEGKPGWAGTGGFAVTTGMKMTGIQPITVGLKVSTNRGAGANGLIEFLQYVGTDADNVAAINWNGGLAIDRSGWGGAVTAADFPNGMFKEVAPVSFGSATEILEDKKQPIALFSYRARTETGGFSDGGRYLARLSPAAGGFDHQSTDANTLFSLPYEPVMEPLTGGLDRSFDVLDGKGFFGASYRADLGQRHIVARSIPREPPLSLAAFQHASANGVKEWIYAGSAKFHDRIMQPSISHAIGNSFAAPSIAPGDTEGEFNGMYAADHSWLANDALWDRWFVSSLATRDSPYHSADQKGSAAVLFNRFSGNGLEPGSLPNQHFLYAGKDPAADADIMFPGGSAAPDAYRRIASLHRIRGAFNVNSTNPDAWRAFFSSTAKLRIPVDSAIDRNSSWEDSQNAIAALLIPNGGAVEADDLDDPSDPDQWLGFRDLTDTELRDLADAMVAEVKARGPFLSISDFVNRRVGTDPDLAAKGALQAALDKTVNQSLETGPRASAGAAGTAFPQAEKGSKMSHVPGHVKQADVLTSLGSLVQVRGDTFTIRAYGEARDAAGNVTASASCEAVVRREAGWVDPKDDPLTMPGNLTSPSNKVFGRGFKIISFRWLNADKA